MVAVDAPINVEEKAYQYEKGRMRAQAEYGEPIVPQRVQVEYVLTQPKKRHTFW